jgi:hypothetical protein
VAKKIPLLEQMRRNPRADWTIDDVAKLCRQHDIELDKPSSGSHYTAYSPHFAGQMAIPRKRPIKPIYITGLIDLIDAAIEMNRENR